MNWECESMVWARMGTTEVIVRWERPGTQIVRDDEHGAIVLPATEPDEHGESGWQVRTGNVPVYNEGEPALQQAFYTPYFLDATDKWQAREPTTNGTD
jgi:hypothetical protein